MSSNVKSIKQMTKAERKALAAKAAKARKAGATGLAMRQEIHPGLTGPVRRSLFREFGHDELIAGSYDRAAAKAKREAEQVKADEKVVKPARKRAAKPKASDATPTTAA